MEKINETLGKLEKVNKGDIYYADSAVKRLYSELIREAVSIFPDKSDKLMNLKKKTIERHHGPFGSDILEDCKFVRELLSKKGMKSKSFLSYKELIEQARIALKNGDDAYTINLCDSAVEVFLKNSFDVPMTIIGAGNVKFLSECMILDTPKGMKLYLREVKNKVSQMDNQIKHKAYVPSKLDAINALKAIEELFVRKGIFENLNEEEKRKVQVGIGL